MRPYSSGSDDRQAITDLYDTMRGTFLVRYPVGLVITVALTGLVAFMVSGFLGFNDREAQTAGSPLYEPSWTRVVFHQPWLLFLWFCVLIVMLQVSILRHAGLRGQLIATLLVSGLCMALVGLAYYSSVVTEAQGSLGDLMARIDHNPQALQQMLESSWFQMLLNVGGIIIFGTSTAIRWRRRMYGQAPARLRQDSAPERTSQLVSDDLPTMQELVAADLFLGALLLVALATLVTLESSGRISHVYTFSCAATSLAHCIDRNVSLPLVDFLLALLACLLGTALLAQAGVHSPTRQGPGGTKGDEEELPAVLHWQQKDANRYLHRLRLSAHNTLLCMWDRLTVRVAINNVVLSLRNVAWPLLILLGVIAAAAVSRDIQSYLHLISDQRTCTTPACPDYQMVQEVLSSGQQYLTIVQALLWVTVGVFAIVFSVTLLIFKWRVADNTMRFLGLIGFIVLLTWWIFSLGFSGFNLLFSLSRLSSRVPFPQPSISTIVSFACLLFFGAWVLLRSVRGPLDGAQPPVMVDATTTKTMEETT